MKHGLGVLRLLSMQNAMVAVLNTRVRFCATLAAPRTLMERPAPPPVADLVPFCFKAACKVTDKLGDEVGQQVGFSTMPDIADEVEKACKLRHGKLKRACAPATLAIIDKGNRACRGEIIFEYKPGYTNPQNKHRA
jgi:hypothetical protein